MLLTYERLCQSSVSQTKNHCLNKGPCECLRGSTVWVMSVEKRESRIGSKVMLDCWSSCARSWDKLMMGRDKPGTVNFPLCCPCLPLFFLLLVPAGPCFVLTCFLLCFFPACHCFVIGPLGHNWSFCSTFYQPKHCSTVLLTALPCPALPCPALHCTALHCTLLHCTALH